jgi:hypothetical protein
MKEKTVTTKTVIPLRKFALEYGYEDMAQLEKDAQGAGVLFEEAGAKHIWVEGWGVHLQKAANKKFAKNKTSDRTLADTDQLGIVRSNLIRLPVAIQKKERRLKQIDSLFKSTSSDDEKFALKSEARALTNGIRGHQENLLLAQESLKRIQEERRKLLAQLEAEDSQAISNPEKDKK